MSFVHGTYGGYQQHRKRSEDPCTACAQACADYMRDFRRRRPDVHKPLKTQQNVRSRALRRLAARHPDELSQLIAEETKREKDIP